VRSGIAFVEGEDFAQIHAENADQDLDRVLDPAQRDRLRVIFMTSSASRGLSFPKVNHLLLAVPSFSLETNLMEIVQTLYRGRGGERDLGAKHVTFYITELLVIPDGPQGEAVARERTLGLLTLLCLVKLCVLTRLCGAARLRERLVALIPIGGKSVGAAAHAFHHDLASSVAALARARRGPHTNDPALLWLEEVVQRLLASATISLDGEAPSSYLALYEGATTERLDDWLVSDEAIEPAFTLGGLLIVPVAGRQLEVAHHLPLQGAIALARDPRTNSALRSLYGRRAQFAPSLVDGLKEIETLLDALEQVERSQRMEHVGRPEGAYYVLPMAAFVAKEAIAAYCQALADDPLREEERQRLRAVLLAYVRDAYPVETALRLGGGYRRMPFLVVTSQDLAALRANRFRMGHTLLSHELNLLTLLLADE
jgi:hypothetical protein